MWISMSRLALGLTNVRAGQTSMPISQMEVLQSTSDLSSQSHLSPVMPMPRALDPVLLAICLILL